MRVLKSYVAVPVLSVVAMMTLATVFLPQVISGHAIKDGPVLFGAPFRFIAQDWSRQDPPPDYVNCNSGLISPWEYPIKEFYIVGFLINIFLISIPVFIPLILAEIMLRFEMMRKK